MRREPLAARFAEVTQAANEGDFGPFMTLWTEDAVWIAGGDNPFSGSTRGVARRSAERPGTTHGEASQEGSRRKSSTIGASSLALVSSPRCPSWNM